MRGLLVLVGALVVVLGLVAIGALGRSCPAGLLQGTLVEDPPGQLSIRADGGVTYSIVWPLGYSTRRLDDGRLAVVDWFGLGESRAAAGEAVELPGGEAPGDRDATYAVCGNMDSLRR